MTNAVVFEDAFNLLCGKLIGEGVHRKVFACKLLPNCVVKVEEGDYRFFANILEARLWDHAPHSIRGWLAPVEFVSPDGRLLVQKKVRPIMPNEIISLPDKVPAFLDDKKIENFGWYDGRLVCVDYAIVNATWSSRLKKAEWIE